MGEAEGFLGAGTRPGEGRVAVLPRIPAPMLKLWLGPQGEWTDAQKTSRHQDSEEQQGHPPTDRQ